MNFITGYAEQGYGIMPSLFSPDEVRSLCDGLSALFRGCDSQGRHPLPGVSVQFEADADLSSTQPEARELQVRKFLDLAQADQRFWDRCRDARLVAVLDLLLGPAARLLQSQALVKPPGIGIAKDWHQDIPYFPIAPRDQAVGVWIALDDADPDNGCMQVVPGSQRCGERAHVSGPTGHRLGDEDLARAAAEALPLPMAAGSALFFSPLLWHHSGPNRSGRRRRAVQFHYVSVATTASWPLWTLEQELPPRAHAAG